MFKSWKKRWFILTNNGIVSYYHSHKDLDKPIAEFSIKNYTTLVKSTKIKHGIILCTLQRNWKVIASNDKQRSEWLRAFESAGHRKSPRSKKNTLQVDSKELKRIRKSIDDTDNNLTENQLQRTSSMRMKIDKARLVNQDITEEQIEEIVDSNDPTAFMQKALMIPDAMIDRVVDIEKRHQGILNIEKGVKELQELWGQSAVLIDEQQEQLDHIENNVERTMNYAQKGNKNLKKAKSSQENARKTAFCLIMLVFIIAMLLVFVPF